MRVVKADEKRKQAVHSLSCGYIRVRKSRYVICFYFLLQHKVGKVQYFKVQQTISGDVGSAIYVYFASSLTVR